MLEDLHQFVELAYRKTRADIYHEKGDLLTRVKFARVGADPDKQANVFFKLARVREGDEQILDALTEETEYVIQAKSFRPVSKNIDDSTFWRSKAACQ